MERADTNLGHDSDPNGITTGPLVARQLFDPITHEAIKQFLDERVPLMSVGVDTGEFVRTYAHKEIATAPAVAIGVVGGQVVVPAAVVTWLLVKSGVVMP